MESIKENDKAEPEQDVIMQVDEGFSENNGPLNILIVGDWVIDEYWTLVSHNSDISSHVGFNHFRSDQDKIFIDLCGAGQVARLLYQLGDPSKVSYRLFGLGYWNKIHQSLIRHLIHSREIDAPLEAIDPYCQIDPCCKMPDKIEINLASLNPEVHTLRVVRQYHRKEGKLEQISRIDWGPKIDNQINKKISLKKIEPALPSQIDTIIVHDLTKGVVIPSLIEALQTKFKDARWYIRSKHRGLVSKEANERPPWLNFIPEDKIELLLIAPEVAELASPWRKWLSKNNGLSRQAWEVLEELPGKNVVLLSAEHEIMGRVSLMTDNGVQKFCIAGKSNLKPDQLTELNWPSAFFASLTHKMLGKPIFPYKKDDEGDEIGIAIAKSLEEADLQSGLMFPSKQAQGKNKRTIPSPTVGKAQLWSQIEEGWNEAVKELGVVDKKRLELWRGTHFDDYIVCIKEKQKIINKIGRALRSFGRTYGSQKRSLSILLNADPGSGKTALAGALARAFNFAFVSFNITEMLKRDDLMEIFDTIANMQARHTRPIMVFIDEINAHLEGSHVYGAFLAPLEEGRYVRQGKFMNLRPCAWIFAGTKMFSDKVERGEKLSDFHSRMTMMFGIDFESLKPKYKRVVELRREARLEQVYIGATMIRKYFPDVHSISKEVLKQFYDLEPDGDPARTMLKLVTSLENVQFGTITRENCGNWEGLNWSKGTKDQELLELDF